jgi:hypothetical protein
MSYYLPKVVWVYWDKNVPNSVLQILENNKKQLPDWDFVFFDEKTVQSYLDMTNVSQNYSKLSPAHKADYIRLMLLNKYGGLWLDSSIIINDGREISKMYKATNASYAQLCAFTLGEPEEKYIENWFIMAPQNSPIISAWINEYNQAIEIGFSEYKKKLFLEGIDIVERIYKKEDKNTYLTQHACLQKVLQRIVISQNILLYKSEYTMFKLHFDCDWKTDCILHRLKSDKTLKNIPFIKLRGSERPKDLSEYFGLKYSN